MRQLFLDTETTGLSLHDNHRVIELGIIEMIDRKLTGNNIHFYFKPNIKVDPNAFKIHGINDSFLMDKPLFKNKIDQIMNYIKGSEVIIHNSSFDLSFLNHELKLCKNFHEWKNIESYCTITDTLSMARSKYPRQRNSLDALCSRYGINYSNRLLHGALKDAELLSKIYLMMTGGQINLFSSNVFLKKSRIELKDSVTDTNLSLKKDLIKLSDIKNFDNNCHEKYLVMLDKFSNNNTLWRKLISSDN